MITDNLASLFGGDPEAVRFRQGTVLAWNPNTGANTIDVGGGTLTDVSMLTTGEAIALKPGHVVGLLLQGGSWFIIGRITAPGDPNFAGASVAFAEANAYASGFTVPGALDSVIASTTLAVPPWADQAAVMCTVSASVANTRTVVDFVQTRSAINGVGGTGILCGAAPLNDASGNYFVSLVATMSLIVTNPGPTIPIAGRIWTDSGIAWSGASTSGNTIGVSAIAMFRSTI